MSLTNTPFTQLFVRPVLLAFNNFSISKIYMFGAVLLSLTHTPFTQLFVRPVLLAFNNFSISKIYMSVIVLLSLNKIPFMILIILIIISMHDNCSRFFVRPVLLALNNISMGLKKIVTVSSSLEATDDLNMFEACTYSSSSSFSSLLKLSTSLRGGGKDRATSSGTQGPWENEQVIQDDRVYVMKLEDFRDDALEIKAAQYRVILETTDSIPDHVIDEVRSSVYRAVSTTGDGACAMHAI